MFFVKGFSSMSNIIALVWDFDKTLIPGYMQEPLFKRFNVDAAQFWREVSELPDRYMREQEVRVNPDTILLNHILHYVREGRFPKLTNHMLQEFGKQLVFYKGIPEIFKATRDIVSEDPSYAEFDIKVEHYIVSTGLRRIIQGSAIQPYITCSWGCELIEQKDADGDMTVAEIGYTLDNTSKTRALFEINKGTPQNNVEVNSNIPENLRRVHFKNMIYIADGPSDIPAFSLINKNGGSTFAVYPQGDGKAFKQVEQLRQDGRIAMYAPADYSRDTTAYLWLTGKVKELADRIRTTEKNKFEASVTPAPVHIV